MIEGQNLDQAKRHPDVVKNIIKKDGRKDAMPYSPSNPPPYPVTSVNGQEGDVLIPQAEGGRIWYATCSTASGTGAKVATSSTGDFVLATGSMARVKFTTSNTAANPTISIDGSTAKTIQPKSGTSGMANLIAAGEVVDLVYDGTNFIMTKGSSATTTFYGITKLNSATDSTSTTEAATPSAVKSAYDLADGKVAKAGDTMTGNLVMSSKNVYIKSSHITQGTTPASNQYGNAVALRDSADKDMGLVRAVSYTDSRQGITLLTQRPVNGTTVYNELALHVKSDGTRVVNVTDAAPWRTALNAVNKSGDTMSGALTVSSGNITASAGSIIAGTDGNTAAERQISCRSGAGTVYLYSQASATGSRGIYVPAHGTGAAKTIIGIDTNNYSYFNGDITGNAPTATKATQDADGNDIRVKYFNVYNTNNVNKSSTLTFNDLAKQGWAGGMFNPATDNPRGAAGWTMAYTASWNKNQNTDWVWQIANQPRNGGFGTERMWYRSTQGGGITGQGWITLQDSKLLWTNASPNADFAAQKVSLTLTGFDAVKIVFYPFGGGDAATGVVEIPVGKSGNLFYMYFNTSTTGSAIAFLNGTSRTCSVATDGVTFSAGQMVYNNGVYTNWNGRSVPWKIYGVHW